MKKLNLLTYIMALFLVVTSCDEPGYKTLLSESFVELDAATAASARRVYSYLRVNDGNNKPSGFKLNLASAPLSTDVNVTFEVVAASTTAIANVHYVVNSTSVTIPAGQNIVELPIDIIVDNIDAGETFDIVIRLVSANVNIEPNLDQATHRIQITCNSDIGGSYNALASGDFGDGSGGSAGTYSNYASVITFTPTATAGVYAINDITFGLYDQGYGDASPAGRLRDVCDNVSGAGLGNSDQYGDPFTINSTRNASTGVITLTWSNTWGDTGSVVLTPQ
jgi:hypothetical protein